MGIEAAIILIAFVIVAAAFSFMVVNMGLTATQRGKEAVAEGLREASSPLTIDGSILIRETNGIVNAIIVPLKVIGVRYVPMGVNKTVVSIKIGQTIAYANVYTGVNKTIDPSEMSFNDLIDNVTDGTAPIDATLFLEDNNGDDAFDFNEKGYLVIKLGTGYEASPRDNILIEIRPEKHAPLSIEFIVPENLPMGNDIYVRVV